MSGYAQSAIFKLRHARLRGMRDAGLTLQAIADTEGVSRQRVHQILGPTRRPKARRA